MKKEKDRRMFERYQAVYLYTQGKTRKEIATIIGRNEKTVSQYIRAYQTDGIDGLQMNHSPGAPRRLTFEQEEQFKRMVVEHLPHEAGFPSKFNWTLHLTGEYIKREFQVSYSLQGVAGLANRLNLSYTKPTYTLAAADPIKQQRFQEEKFPE
ncbi:IS630 family transposase [Paenibacillus xylanivorans]|uniref:Transposase n=1 Tax=Paenibacillus xylanivorans TaxID=1705561 RepID=A0A0M9BTX7_9BACL|nr:IS630 family transposase [Paenibacillus xylanivorans]KOY18092.1 transposase [Paenibacillus xylanivorans]